MADREITWNGSIESLYRSLYQLPAMLAENGPFAVQAMDAIGRAVARTLAEAFDVKSAGGTDRFGIQWAPLADFTVQKKGHAKILVDTGALREAMDPSNDFLVETFANEVVVRIVADGVGFQQTGFRVVPGSPVRSGGAVLGFWGGKETKAPARPVIPNVERLTPEWWEEVLSEALPEIVSAMADWLQAGGGG